MTSQPPTVEELIPQREGMKLLDEIIRVDGDGAAARAVVSPDWPLCRDGAVGSVLMVELVAQTVAAVYGWRKLGGQEYTSGYLVGVKKAAFEAPVMPVGSELVVEVAPLYEVDDYGVHQGTVHCGSELWGRVELQVITVEDGE